MFNLKNFLIITNSYLIFTLTDGAIRMIVLLHFFHLGFSPFLLAILFLLYEFMGIITNFFGGWVASFLGIKRMLNVGILLQIIGIYLYPSIHLHGIYIFLLFGLCLHKVMWCCKRCNKNIFEINNKNCIWKRRRYFI